MLNKNNNFDENVSNALKEKKFFSITRTVLSFIKGTSFNHKEEIAKDQVNAFVIASMTTSLVVLIFLIIAMFPLKETRYELLYVEPSTRQIVFTEPIVLTKQGHKEIVELLSSRFVTLLFEINDDKNNFRKVFDISSDNLRSEISTLYLDENPVNPYKIAKQLGYKRSVHIINSLKVADNIVDVKFKLIDVDESTGERFGDRELIVKIEYGIDEGKFYHVSKSYINPIGFYVKSFSLVGDNNQKLSVFAKKQEQIESPAYKEETKDSKISVEKEEKTINKKTTQNQDSFNYEDFKVDN